MRRVWLEAGRWWFLLAVARKSVTMGESLPRCGASNELETAWLYRLLPNTTRMFR
jgi:hypothetical protein